jgi:hypothetical protein
MAKLGLIKPVVVKITRIKDFEDVAKLAKADQYLSHVSIDRLFSAKLYTPVPDYHDSPARSAFRLYALPPEI